MDISRFVRVISWADLNHVNHSLMFVFPLTPALLVQASKKEESFSEQLRSLTAKCKEVRIDLDKNCVKY